MSGFKRLCKIVFALAGLFALVALALTWVGPWTDVASALLVVDGYWYAIEACWAIAALGLVVNLFQGLFGRKVRTVQVATVDGGRITVTREAIASQAKHIVEADGTCGASKVVVDAKPRGHVKVFVRVLPRETVDVVVKGAQLHEELVQGLAAVCGNTVEDVSLEFVEPESFADLREEDEAGAVGIEGVAVEAAAAEPAEQDVPEPTSEITVSMASARDASKEA